MPVSHELKLAGTGVTEANINLSDVTTDDVSITKHGFAPKAPNDATKFLNGVGAYSVPSGGGSGTVTHTGTLTANQIIVGNGSADIKVSDLTGDVTTSGGVGTTISNGAVTDTKASLLVKPSVGLVSTSNLTLSGGQTIDGVAGTVGQTLVLATAQTTGSENGPWVMQTGAWTRPTWYPSGGTTQAIQFSTTFVRLGTSFSGSVWRLTTSGAITIDTTATTWAQTPISVNTNSVSNGVTGSGSVVLATSPTLVTPVLGVASATSINKVTITAPATGSTLTILDGKTLTVDRSIEFTTSADGNVYTLPTSSATLVGTVATQTLSNKTIDTANNTINIAGTNINAVTGSGSVVLATSPTLVTPNIGAATGTSLALTGLIGTYNNIVTVSNGIPSIYGSVNLTTQAAAIAATTLYTPASTGAYRIYAYAKVTRAATTSSVLGGATGLVITYQDSTDNVAQTVTMAMQNTTGTVELFDSGNSTTTLLAGQLVVHAGTGAPIQYAFGYTSVGGTTMQYTLRLKIERL